MERGGGITFSLFGNQYCTKNKAKNATKKIAIRNNVLCIPQIYDEMTN
jgi:hypothetical protein